MIGDSSQDHLQNLTFWKYNNRRDFPQQRSTTINGLESVTATGSYAGGIAGNLQPTTVAGLLNSVVKIGDIATLKKFDQFAAFTVENVSVTAAASGLTVTAGSYYAGGAIGCATGGDVTNTNLTNLATVSAKEKPAVLSASLDRATPSALAVSMCSGLSSFPVCYRLPNILRLQSLHRM